MGNHNRATWSQLLHKSRNRNNFEENTMSVLRILLQRIKDGENLDAIIDKYISEKEEAHEYDWRYYFVKYPDMLRGADGELKWDKPNDYICITLNKHQFNGQHWNPFLNVIYQILSDNGIESDDTLRDVRQKDGDKVPFSNPQFQETGGTGMNIVHELTVGNLPGEVGECLCVASDAGHSVCCHIVEGALRRVALRNASGASSSTSSALSDHSLGSRGLMIYWPLMRST